MAERSLLDAPGTGRLSAITTATDTRRISILALGASALFSLRLEIAAAGERGKVGSFRLDVPINSCVVSGERVSARLGPDEWLILGPRAEHAELARDLDDALAGRFASLVDISHRNCAFQVSGLHAREVINGGCPLDLDDAAFPPGRATRTILGKAEIVLLRPGAPHRYRIECWRSFAPYVQALLADVAREFEMN